MLTPEASDHVLGLLAVDWRIASLIAVAVTVAAALPSTVSVHEVAGPGTGGGPVPDARQNARSPSFGVNAGSTAREIPALAIRATIPQPRLSSVASVHTHASVVLWPGRAAQPGRCAAARHARHGGHRGRFHLRRARRRRRWQERSPRPSRRPRASPPRSPPRRGWRARDPAASRPRRRRRRPRARARERQDATLRTPRSPDRVLDASPARPRWRRTRPPWRPAERRRSGLPARARAARATA